MLDKRVTELGSRNCGGTGFGRGLFQRFKNAAHVVLLSKKVLKHDPATRDIPIIALTAHALASDREKAMEVGCDGYLAKPCEPRAVVAEVQRFLGKDVTQNAG